MIEVKKEAITKELVDAWYAEWEALQQAIHEAHSLRDGSAGSLMEQGIALFERLVVDSAQIDAPLSLQEEYELLPINGAERLAFIKMRPGQYACYRQLDELFKETKKRCARLRLKA
ncbi:MAG: YpoC family protein [Solibacillus sp.]